MTADREHITYEFADTTVGRLLVAFSESGVVWVSFVETDTDALEALARRFDRADLRPDEGERRVWLEAVVAWVDDPAAGRSGVPLDLRGTDFQREVWDALLAIPAGETRSYADVAQAIGRPTAVRAVAQACGANPIGIVVPCHRVIGSDGSLTGYASGLGRKRALLEREGLLTRK